MSMQSGYPHRNPAIPAGTWFLLVLSVAFGALSTQLAAQLPGPNPVKPSAAVPSTQPINSFAAPAATLRPPHRSHITFANGLLTVSASNASLNGLIRDIARQTGMKVSGSVAEDRVFGEYGPADPQVILATLLDGTGSNILIRSSSSDSPLELILTPRTGAATPPNPNANVADDENDDQAPPGSPTAVSARRTRTATPPRQSSATSPPSSASAKRHPTRIGNRCLPAS